MANVNHDDEVPVVEQNQHNDVPVVLEPVLEDVDKVPEEDEFKEEEDPQDDEDDIEIDIEEDENETELTYPYEEVDPLNPLPPASESEPDNEIEVENLIEHEDETVFVNVYKVGKSSTAAIPQENGDRLLPGFMRWDIDSLFVRSIVDQGTTTMERLVEKLGNVKEKAECKKLKKELEEAKIMPPKSAPMTQGAMRRMIKESVDVVIAVERERQAKVRNDASGSGPVRGQNTAPAVRECTFAGFMKCNPIVFCGIEGAIELRRWFEKTESVFGISECVEGKKVRFAAATLEGPTLTWWNSKVATLGLENVNQMPWTKMKQLMTAKFCPIEEIQRLENELWNLKVKEVKVDAYIRGLMDNIKGEVTLSKPTNLSEVVCMDHKLMEQKSQARNERILEGKKQKITKSKVGHKLRYCKEKNVSTGANAQPILTCYDCFEQGHTGNRCSKKVKQEEVGEVHARAYAIKDAEPKGSNVVTSMFLLNNRYASVLHNSGFDRSFVNTRFSSLLDTKPIKIEDIYEVELADGRIVSTNTVLKGCTLSLGNHIFKIDLMPIELGTFDVIISMDWLVKH
ncbi:putative reverse transcriptase domain-containing protein, partial [Tanacetum coccineum]